MNWYSRNIFPCVCDLFLNCPPVARLRRELLAHVYGNILEIGFGTGLNLPFYPQGVGRLTTADPNTTGNWLVRQRIKRSKLEVEQREISGEQLPFDDGSFDCVVSTFTLCSIPDASRAMTETYRVLKPGGNFLCLEHGLSPDQRVQRWQRRLNWLQMHLADGCRLDRNIRDLVTTPPFSVVRIDQSYLERFPKTHGYMTRGVATK